MTGRNPEALCALLELQDTHRFEVVGFYDTDGGHAHVKKIERPRGFRAQLDCLLSAVSGDWFVFAEPSMHLYSNWASSLLSHSAHGGEVVQWVSVHEDDPLDAESLMSFKPPVDIGTVYGGTPQPMHRFAFSKSLQNSSDFWRLSEQVVDVDGFRLYVSFAALSAQPYHAHVGATAYVAASLPEVPADVLPDFYKQHQRKTMFDRAIRSLQNERLVASKLYFMDTGRVTIAHFIANEVTPTLDALTALQRDTYVPFKSMVFGSLPRDSMRVALRTFRDEYSDLGAVLNSTEVVGPKLLNQALCRIGSDAIVLLDPSIVLPKRWLAKLLWTMQAHPNAGVFCLPSNQAGVFDLRCCVITKRALNDVGGFELDATLLESVNDFLARVVEAGLSIDVITDWTPEFRVIDGGALLQGLAQTHAKRLRSLTHIFVPCAAESGYQPETGPVTVVNGTSPALLAYPDWDAPSSLTAWLSQMTVGDGWTVFLRCPVGEGSTYVDRLTEILAPLPQHHRTRFQLVDAMLAAEREAGLLVGVDAVYVDRSWKDAGLWIRRTLDSGCRLITDIDSLNEVLNA